MDDDSYLDRRSLTSSASDVSNAVIVTLDSSGTMRFSGASIISTDEARCMAMLIVFVSDSNIYE